MNKSNNMDCNSRIFYTDFLRIIAVILVLLTHISARFVSKYDVTSNEFIIGNIFDSISRAAVPLFVMISGVFMLDENREITIEKVIFKYCKNIVLLYIVWSLFYAAADNIIHPMLFKGAVINIEMMKGFIKEFIFGAYHMWYLIMIVGVYLTTPILRQFVKKNKIVYVKYFLILAFAIQFVIPTIIYFVNEYMGISLSPLYQDLQMNFVLGFTSYFILGWYIHNVGINRVQSRVIYIMGILSIILMIVFTQIISVKNNEITTTLYGNLGLLDFMYSISIFIFFANNLKNKKSGVFLKRIATLTFGAYILHVEILNLYLRFFPYKDNVLVYILVQWFVIIIISFGSSFILQKIPYIKKAIRG